MWINVLIIAHISINLTALYLLIKDGSRPIRIWAWILVILFLPVIGVLLYSFFGINLRKRKLFDLKRVIDYNQFEQFLKSNWTEIEHMIEKRDDVTSTYLNLIRLLTQVNGSLLTFNNKIRILNDGPETFETIFAACEAAKEYINLQYYIFLDGDLANRFAEIFEKKIQEGVDIRLLYDHLGSWNITKNYIDRLKAMGVKAYPFMPVHFGTFARVNYRNHRKIVVVDGDVGFTGGINVDDKYIHDDPFLGHWTDTHVRVSGMCVNFLNFVFLCDWQFVSGENLLKRETFKLSMPPHGDTPVQIVSSGPDTDYPNILQQYLYVLTQANHYVYIANPYIVPDATLLMALKTTALSGVDVRIVVPAHSESWMVHWSVRSFFTELLRAGVKILLYQEGFIHSKVVLSDDAVCSIGTANLDIRSFEQNFEVNALIYEREATLQLRKQFEQFEARSKRLNLNEHEERPMVHRIKEKIARLSSPLL